jgi:competence protein ComEC
MKRPLASIAIAYGSGILLADRFSMPLQVLLVCSAVVTVLALVLNRGRLWLLLFAAFLTGAASFTFHTSVLSPHDLRLLATNPPVLVEIRGVLGETPSQRIYQDGDEQVSRTLAELEVTALRCDNNEWQPATGRVASSTPGLLPQELTRASRVQVAGVLEFPPTPLAAGLFDYRAYLQRRGIYYQLKCSGAVDWIVERAAPLSLSERFTTWAKTILKHGLPEEDESLRLLWAMTLGWRTGLGGDVSEPFMRSGTMHVFAISGLHIALIATILVVVLRVCGVPRRYCGWIVIPLIWFYTGATGWQASAIRSTLMSSVVIAGWTLRRPNDLLNSLAGAALIILVWDPQQLFQAGFLLSFAVVLSMALFEPVMRPFRDAWMQPDPFLPDKLQPRWAKWRRWAWVRLTPGVITSAAAWLGSIPLVACFFHLFTPVTLVANLIIVPLSSLALISSLASLTVGGLLPSLAAVFNHSSWFIMVCMVRLSEWFANLPGAYFHVAAPGVVTLVLYCGLLVAILAGWLKRSRHRRLLLAGAAALATVWFVESWLSQSKTELTVLPLQASHAVYVDAKSGGDWLIDCGSETAARFATRPFLAARGVNRIPHLALTHGDIQHVEGMHWLNSAFTIGTSWVGPTPFRSKAYRDALAFLESVGRPARLARHGDVIGPWTILHPSAGDGFALADDRCLVLRGQFDGVRVLLLSDLGQAGQKELLQRNSDLQADIVITGFPRRGEPLVDALFQAIRPKLVVLAETPEPMSELHLRKVRERLAKGGAEVIETRRSGAVTISIDKSWSVASMKPPRITAMDESSARPHSEPEE